MTILQALDGYYARMAADNAVETPGWSREKFGWCVVMDADGAPVAVLDLRDTSGKKPSPRLYVVPAGGKRTSGIAANLLWDKSAYSLGRTASNGKRTAQEHACFVAVNLARIGETDDPGLVAFTRFLRRWTPERFDAAPFRPEMLDANIMFRLDGDPHFLHERPAARALIERGDTEEAEAGGVFCLVTGTQGKLATLHPTIKGVEGGQTSGGSLVSFNLDAFTSYGKEQGANAPTSEAAAFRYGAALNRLLTRGGGNRVSRAIGDATTVFWADASGATPGSAEAAEDWISDALSMEVTDAGQARKIADQLEKVSKGQPLETIDPKLEPGVGFHVLGLAPNAARLSVRFWLTEPFGAFAERLALHHTDLGIEPSPWRISPSVQHLLRNIAVPDAVRKGIGSRMDYNAADRFLAANHPSLAGEMMRAVLTGTDYPRTLLGTALQRLRAGDDPAGGWHAAAMRAVLHRRQRREPAIIEEGATPMALTRERRNIGYQLGRLFAVYELAQVAALGRNVKATMRDKYFGGAAANPAGIFPLIISNGQNHLGKARKVSPGWAYLIERELDEVMSHLEPRTDEPIIPRSLKLDQQAEFAIGYYHQRRAKLSSDKGETLSLAETDDMPAAEDEND